MSATVAITKMELNSKPAILCIDQSLGMLLVCQALLEAHGYIVYTASNVRAGLDLLKQNTIDAVVMDSEFEEISTIKLAREIRNIRQDAPLVVFSSSSHPELDYTDIGVFLDKSQGPKALLKAIDRICKP